MLGIGIDNDGGLIGVICGGVSYLGSCGGSGTPSVIVVVVVPPSDGTVVVAPGVVVAEPRGVVVVVDAPGTVVEGTGAPVVGGTVPGTVVGGEVVTTLDGVDTSGESVLSTGSNQKDSQTKNCDLCHFC